MQALLRWGSVPYPTEDTDMIIYDGTVGMGHKLTA